MWQSQRKIEKHIPAEEIPMNHADLLTFNGGRILHSMFPAPLDKNFDPDGHEFRYSLLFRWTTDEMRELGTRQKVLEPTSHAESYRAAVVCYRGGLIDYLGTPIA